MARRTSKAQELEAAESAPLRNVRFVLSETAVRRLRTADQILHDLWVRVNEQCPAWLANDVAMAHLTLTEAVNEINRCNIEQAPAEEAA